MTASPAAYVLALDEGTTNAKAFAVAPDGTILSAGSAPVPVGYPQLPARLPPVRAAAGRRPLPERSAVPPLSPPLLTPISWSEGLRQASPGPRS